MEMSKEGKALKGKMIGMLPPFADALILSNCHPSQKEEAHDKEPGLEPELTKALFNSLGAAADLQTVTNGDTTDFTIDIPNPNHVLYKPFFFDRLAEAGKFHTYYEALCHAFPHRKTLMGCSARYFKPLTGCPIVAPQPPATLHITAFVEAVRNLNSEFLVFLRGELEDLIDDDEEDEERVITQECVDSFVAGVFRNVAIQYHYDDCSHPINRMLHMDHIFSAVHMAVTLNGERNVAFVADNGGEPDTLIFKMKSGDAYVTCPAAILHGIETNKLDEKNCSVALQCRTWLSGEEAKIFHKNNEKTFIAVLNALERHPIILPTFSQWEQTFEELKESLAIDVSEEGIHNLVSFHNFLS